MSTGRICMRHISTLVIFGTLVLAGCGGGGGGSSGGNSVSGSTSSSSGSGTSYTASSGVAQKGPLILGSTVTAQQLDASLSPTGQQFSYQITSDLGTFSPTSMFTSQYIGLNATGYYFDEIQNAISTGPVTLNGYSDLAVESVLNVNLLTTLAYQRTQKLVTNSAMSFTAARTQAENEVLAALNIPAGSYGSFSTFDISGSSDGDHILTAISSLFVYGNSAGPLSQLIANFQSDIGANGVITNSATKATLIAAAKGINPEAVAANLTQYYASEGITFTAANISEWIAQSGDGVIGKFAFQVADATPSTVFTFPASVVSQFAGTPVTVTAGHLSVNGTVASGAVSFSADDTVTLSPNVGDFPNGVLTCYLVNGTTNLAKVSFVSGLLFIAVTPSNPSIPVGLAQQFVATGTFSDTSTSNLTNTVTWSSATQSAVTINANTGLANGVAVGSAIITATSGSVSGNATLTVTPAILESIAVTPNSTTSGVDITTQLTATGTYSDSSTANVTNTAAWLSDTPSVAAVGAVTGLVTGVAPGSANITATVASVTGNAAVSISAVAWHPAGSLAQGRTNHAATLLSSGKVLVEGGWGNGVLVPGAELYDPVSNAWSAAGDLVTERLDDTATLLNNGQVLVAGGAGSGSIYSSAELYDPVANAWSLTGSMANARQAHTANLLSNGLVLVAGGCSSTSLASAELYDPVAKTWSAAGSLATGRCWHTSTLLPNGKVLVVGGYNGNPSVEVSSAELYDPIANSWSSAGNLATARAQHTASLLPNGQVLVVGGTGIGGVYLASAELYDPGSNTWSTVASFPTPIEGHTQTLLNSGKVLVAGGITSGPNNTTPILSSADLYDLATNTWSPTSTLITPTAEQTATLLTSGVVLASGGNSSVSAVTAAESYW